MSLERDRCAKASWAWAESWSPGLGLAARGKQDAEGKQGQRRTADPKPGHQEEQEPSLPLRLAGLMRDKCQYTGKLGYNSSRPANTNAQLETTPVGNLRPGQPRHATSLRLSKPEASVGADHERMPLEHTTTLTDCADSRSDADEDDGDADESASSAPIWALSRVDVMSMNGSSALLPAAGEAAPAITWLIRPGRCSEHLKHLETRVGHRAGTTRFTSHTVATTEAKCSYVQSQFLRARIA